MSLAPLRQWRVSLHTGFVSLTLVLVACIPVSTLPSPGCSENSREQGIGPHGDGAA